MPYTQLTQEDRIALAALLRAGNTHAECARQLKKHRSTIHRELSRNTTSSGTYHAGVAKRRLRARRLLAHAGRKKLKHDAYLRHYVERKLARLDSPEQIANTLKQKHRTTVVSHETIYQWIYQEKPQLKQYLRCRKRKYRRRHGTLLRVKKRKGAEKLRIDARPAIVETRERLGDWEGDTIVGKSRKQRILTLVDRASGYTKAFKLDVVTATAVRKHIEQWSKKLPRAKQHTLTLDNGTEFAEHKHLQENSTLDIYFAYPYHSWERGTNENTNGLLRQFFPKGSSFEHITQQDVDRATRNLNTRPRKRLNYATPADVFYGRVALTT